MEQRGQTTASVGVGRKLVILALLAVGAVVADRLLVGSSHFGPPGMLASGFALLLAFALGQLAVRLHMPAVTGYLVAGLLLGPTLRNMLPPSWVLGPLSWPIIDADLLAQLQPAETVAAGIIAMTVGASLRLARLRGQGRPVAGALLGQLVAVFPAAVLSVVLVGLDLPGMTVPGFEALPLAAAVAFSALAASVALAGSPTATLAVLRGTGAWGVLSDVVLATVVVKELIVVLLFATVAVFVPAPPGQAGHDVSATVLASLLATVGLALGLGFGVAVYLRAVRRQVPLFLFAVVALTVFIANEIQLPAVPLLIGAGLVVAQLAPTAESLVGDLTKIGTPVFLLFFMLFGARLRLDLLVQVAPFALVLVLLRGVALRFGVPLGVRFVAPQATGLRYAWLGFVPQAGVALPLAVLMERTFGEPGTALAALTMAGVVCNELVGPVLLRFGLARSGELPSRVVRGQDATEQETAAALTATSELPTHRPAVPVRRADPWPRTAGVENPWGPPPALASSQLNELLLEFEADLQGLARDVASGRMDAFRKDAVAYLRQLRMELLRHHRHVSNKLVGAEPGTVNAGAVLRGEHSDLAERWGAVALARGARVGIDTWSPAAVVDAVDRMADEVPEFVQAPFEPSSFDHPQDESAFRWIRRLWLRAHWRWARLTDGTPPVRSVAVGTLVRYHLTGLLPARMEGIAALLVDAERQLVDRTRELFDEVASAYTSLAQSVHEVGDDSDLRSQLSALRRQMEEALAVATKEVSHIVEDGAMRIACILGEGLKSIKDEMPRMSTLDLSTFSRRFSSVHAERARAVRRLSEGYEQARKGVAAQYALLALEFEMESLEARVQDAVDAFASELGRSTEGRAHLQLTRIAEALDQTIPRYEQLFESGLSGVELAAGLRAEAKPLERVVSEAARASLQLRDQLTDDQTVAPLLDSVARASRTLTDRYRIPSGRPARGEWRLPALVPVVEVPFRQIVQT
ncbi:MAG: cation:proton antiporter, partial [Polyangiaceae bacterium]|nr:cation:proton antiporter [Polyangiaceae bacterium]